MKKYLAYLFKLPPKNFEYLGVEIHEGGKDVDLYSKGKRAFVGRFSIDKLLIAGYVNTSVKAFDSPGEAVADFLNKNKEIKTPPWPELKWTSPCVAPLPPSFYGPYDKPKDTNVNDNGGKKFDDGKLRYDLIPPKALEQVVKALTHGANKYGDNNWINVEDFRYDAAHGRHYAAWKLGEKYDEDSKAHHLAAAVCNLMFLLEKELEKKEE